MPHNTKSHEGHVSLKMQQMGSIVREIVKTKFMAAKPGQKGDRTGRIWRHARLSIQSTKVSSQPTGEVDPFELPVAVARASEM